jgi:hypothetical protein
VGTPGLLHFVYNDDAEQIDIYSFSGARLFTAKKPAGEASFRIWASKKKR